MERAQQASGGRSVQHGAPMTVQLTSWAEGIHRECMGRSPQSELTGSPRRRSEDQLVQQHTRCLRLLPSTPALRLLSDPLYLLSMAVTVYMLSPLVRPDLCQTPRAVYPSGSFVKGVGRHDLSQHTTRTLLLGDGTAAGKVPVR